MCLDKGNQSDQYLQVTYHIFSNQIFFLTGKIQKIHFDFCFDMKIQINSFAFVFWQRKSIWSIFTDYLSYFFKSNLLFDRKNLENWVEYCVLTGKIKEIHLHMCFHTKNPANWFEFLPLHENSNKYIWICVLTKEINLINIYRFS